MENDSENVCPCCGNHCSREALGCRRGEAYFGMSESEREAEKQRVLKERAHGGGRGPHRGGTRGEPATPEDKALVMLRRCGHYLHHNAGENADGAKLLSCLSEEEKRELIAILKKCLISWDERGENG